MTTNNYWARQEKQLAATHSSEKCQKLQRAPWGLAGIPGQVRGTQVKDDHVGGEPDLEGQERRGDCIGLTLQG